MLFGAGWELLPSWGAGSSCCHGSQGGQGPVAVGRAGGRASHLAPTARPGRGVPNGGGEGPQQAWGEVALPVEKVSPNWQKSCHLQLRLTSSWRLGPLTTTFVLGWDLTLQKDLVKSLPPIPAIVTSFGSGVRVWEGPKHRSFCPRGAWGHRPPGSSTWALSDHRAVGVDAGS